MDILLVDGYNIIGAWPDLQKLKDENNLEDARKILINKMAEYQAYTGMKVIVVFDAHLVKGIEKNIWIIAWKLFSREKMKPLMNGLKSWPKH